MLLLHFKWGVLDYAPALNSNLNVDDTGNTFAGVLNGKFRVYVDPYAANVAASQYYVIGYKGTSPYDSGLFYCPYVPLQMVRAVGQNSFQPKIGFKTRYGMVQKSFRNYCWVQVHLITQAQLLLHHKTYTTDELKLQTLCNFILCKKN